MKFKSPEERQLWKDTLLAALRGGKCGSSAILIADQVLDESRERTKVCHHYYGSERACIHCGQPTPPEVEGYHWVKLKGKWTVGRCRYDIPVTWEIVGTTYLYHLDELDEIGEMVER